MGGDENYTDQRRLLSPRAVITISALVMLVVALVAVVVLVRPGTDGPERVQPGKPRIVTTAELRSFVDSAGQPVWWAGESSARMELTQTSHGRVFIRYLPAGVPVGDPKPKYLTVATYPQRGAYTTLNAAKRKGTVRGAAPGGALFLYRKARPTSIYLAYPGSNYLVEVYAPDAATLRQLVKSGAVGQVR